jgi:hypothetical protein
MPQATRAQTGGGGRERRENERGDADGGKTDVKHTQGMNENERDSADGWKKQISINIETRARGINEKKHERHSKQQTKETNLHPIANSKESQKHCRLRMQHRPLII